MSSTCNSLWNLKSIPEGIVHSATLQTFWTSFIMIAYATNAEIFYKNPYLTFLGLNLKAKDYQYLTKLWNISS